MENFHKKNSKRKKRYVISTLIIIIAFLFGMLSGALYYREALFPIPQLAELIYSDGHTECPTTVGRKLGDLRDISKFNQIDKIFWGDSVVEGMHDSRFYGIQNYQEVAQGGQIVFCAIQEMDLILNLKPDTIIIYLGGNDADGKGWYGPEEAAGYYEEIILTNDSYYTCENFSINKILDRITNLNADIFGLSQNFQFARHLQSYFLIFRRSAFTSVWFFKFWNSYICRC